MGEKRISIIVPIHNVERYIKTCIESILSQTYENIELVLVDDGSTDCSGKIRDEYAERDYRVKVVHKENGDTVSARKTGLNVATGELVTFVDGDDWLTMGEDAACADRNYEELLKQGIDVVSPGEIGSLDYDAIVVAISTSKARNAVFAELSGKYSSEKVHVIDEELIKSEESLKAFGLIG